MKIRHSIEVFQRRSQCKNRTLQLQCHIHFWTCQLRAKKNKVSLLFVDELLIILELSITNKRLFDNQDGPKYSSIPSHML